MSDHIACTSKTCGALNRPGDLHCHACGRALPEGPPREPEDYDIKDVVGWLCCAPLAPVPLGPKPKVTVGRSSECDLVLRHPSVSRHHCTITVGGDRMSLLDEGSSNGTFLNGKRVSQSSLLPGDVLSIGRFEVELRNNDAMLAQEEDLDMEGTRTVTLANITTHLLHEISLAETLQALEFNGRSGTIRLLSGQLRGTLVVQQGRPVWAKLGHVNAEEAVLQMLELKEGRITISNTPEPGPGEGTMATSITGLLLEASRRQDMQEQKQTMHLPRPGASQDELADTEVELTPHDEGS